MKRLALLAAAVLLAVPPARLHVTTRRGSTDITVLQAPGYGPLIPIDSLARALGAVLDAAEPWLTLSTAGQHYRFLAGTPLVMNGAESRMLPAATRRRNGTWYVPLAFASDVLADPANPAFTWNAATMTLAEVPPIIVPPARTTVGQDDRTRLNGGLAKAHRITIDPGHGGTDPGNPGMFFPNGMREKNVTLAVGLLVRDELLKRGVRITMTRSRDTLINLEERAPRFCRDDCDLFLSIHVNSLDPSPGYMKRRGFETYFLSEAKNEDAARVARMENSAVKFDKPSNAIDAGGGLSFMFKDLLAGEILRNSQRAATIVQKQLEEVHDGGNRGVKQANFAVLRTAHTPSILVELGYSTNREDAAIMSGKLGQQNLAIAIADAVMRYLREIEREAGEGSGR